MQETDNVFCLDAARRKRLEHTKQGKNLTEGHARFAALDVEPSKPLNSAHADKAFWQRAEYKKSPENASRAYRTVVSIQNKFIGAFILASAGHEYYKSAVKNENRRKQLAHNRPS